MNALDQVLLNVMSFKPARNIVAFTNEHYRGLDLVGNTIQKKDHVLDVGCGLGLNCLALAHKGCEVVGLEVESTVVKQLKANKPEKLTNVSYVCARAEDMPFESNSFDHIVMSCVLHHIPINVQQKALKEIERVLKKDGTFHLIEPLPGSRFDCWWDHTFFKDNFYGFMHFKGKFKRDQKGSMQILAIHKKDLPTLKITHTQP